MTWFGQSKMVIARNQPSLFDSQNSRDIAGTNRDNRDILTGGEGHEPGHSGTPPLKGGVQCPDGSGSGMSRSRCPDTQALEKRNDRRAVFAAWGAECRRYDAEGRQDELPPLPAGYVSQGMARLQRGTKDHRTWR
jgi:hypothetical protein